MLSSSLGNWEELRRNESANILRRERDQVLDVLQNYINEEDEGPAKNIAFCHLVSLMPFNAIQNQTSDGYNDFAYEASVAIAMAISHLNEGNGILVKEVEGLNERCNIRFTAEFIDTQLDPGITMNRILELTDTSGTRHPSAFLGAFRSAVSGPSSIITGLQGYPQISGASTSALLDDKNQYPKFARTIPSDDGVATSIIQYFSTFLGLEHLAVININDSYGNSFVRGLKVAAAKHAPNMKIAQIPIEENDESIKQAIESLKQTNYRFVFCITFKPWFDVIMEEAARMEAAGDGKYNWMFPDSFSGALSHRKFERGSLLQKAYQGTGMLTSSAKSGSKFQSFSSSMQALKNEEDFQYLKTLIPRFDQTPFFELNSTFMHPINYDYTVFFYDAAILLGLAVCEATGDDLRITGNTLYDQIAKFSSFQGVSGTVALDPNTGTREPNSALYTLTNFVERGGIDEENGMDMVEFETITTDQYSNGTWSSILNYTFNDGTSNRPLGIPSPSTDKNLIESSIRSVMCTLCALTMLLSIGFALWTWYFRKTKVVRASQPFFLLLICLGSFIMGSTIISLQFDHKIADLDGNNIACNAVAWQAFIGFGIVFSSIVCKTHRINIVMRNALRFSRITVTVEDTIKPVLLLTSLNILLLSLMTALNPITYETQIVEADEFDQPLETYSYCSWNNSLRYVIPLAVVNLISVIVAIVEVWKARQIATEFSESQYIFRALIYMVVVFFIGGPIIFIASDNPNALAFVSSGIIFVATCGILLLMFIPKIIYQRKRYLMKKKGTNKNRYSFSLGPSLTDSNALESDYYNTGGEKILTTKTQKELSEEVKMLKRLLKEARGTKKNESERTPCDQFQVVEGENGNSGDDIVESEDI
ncbi:unnamed protein product [Pseudo-nitzschia multistriata]|uniref:G-protein coupled receptors family 3 profile domain-containing protein n=1 Tax=Pseudo-nitzschia multistriata TaxID=183589 RepID=A0A448Z447_9STRA|nr:unnamed protein product [Pseudo-nitzschia multistriata]